MRDVYHTSMASIPVYHHNFDRKDEFIYCAASPGTFSCGMVWSVHFPFERISVRLYLDAFDTQRIGSLNVGICRFCAIRRTVAWYLETASGCEVMSYE